MFVVNPLSLLLLLASLALVHGRHSLFGWPTRNEVESSNESNDFFTYPPFESNQSIRFLDRAVHHSQFQSSPHNQNTTFSMESLLYQVEIVNSDGVIMICFMFLFVSAMFSGLNYLDLEMIDVPVA